LTLNNTKSRNPRLTFTPQKLSKQQSILIHQKKCQVYGDLCSVSSRRRKDTLHQQQDRTTNGRDLEKMQAQMDALVNRSTQKYTRYSPHKIHKQATLQPIQKLIYAQQTIQ
jgi:hypothetical protein